jgi:DNA-binding NtrC family response regulator
MQYSTMNKNILFVDDDTNIHKGLNRLFKQQQVNWRYRFASGVDEPSISSRRLKSMR